MMNRELGESVPVSIGTALILEAILDGVLLQPYNDWRINLRTLARNYLASFNSGITLTLNDYLPVFIEEVQTVAGIIENVIPKNMSIELYVCSYKTLLQHMPNAAYKTKFTNKQSNYNRLEDSLVQASSAVLKFKQYDSAIYGNNKKSVITTHRPIDLLSAPSFSKLHLLESHTAAIRGPATWISKLSNNPKYKLLPFNILTVHLLGDGSYMLKNIGRGFIDPVIHIAHIHKWTPATTMAKIKSNIDEIRDPLLRRTILGMCNVTLK